MMSRFFSFSAMFLFWSGLSSILLFTPSLAARSRNSKPIPSLLQAPRLTTRDASTDVCGELFEGDYTLFTALSVYNCLATVPFNQTVATQFLKYYKDTLEFQSTLTYLKNPPSSYQQPGVDLLGGLDRLQRDVDTGIFSNEYQFEVALQDLVYSAHDGHIFLYGGATDIFSFGSPFYISSVSADGVAIPEVYMTDDLIESLEPGAGWTASPIATINGQDITAFLTQFAAVNSLGFSDSHADWNNLMYSPAADIQGLVNAFQGSSPFYPGDVFGLVFKNGTGIGDWEWLAVLNDPRDLVPIADAADFYSNFVVNTYSAPATQRRKAKAKRAPDAATTTQAAVSTVAATTTAPLTAWTNGAYPTDPVIIQPNLGDGGVVTGYFIDKSIGVLSIPNFDVYGDDVKTFSSTITQFLQQSKSSGIQRIAIDLQQNYGGTRLLATDTFKQFFPSIDPFGGSRERASQYLNVLGNTDTNYYNTYVTPLNASLYDYFTTSQFVSPIFLNAATGQNFTSWAEYFGPTEDRLDYFTTTQRDNLSSIPFDENNLGEVVYGFANNTANASQPYAAEDIILLTDSMCASTCTLFVEMMHYEAGVRTVAAGGRPQLGPIQTAAGTRGAKDYEADSLDLDIYGAVYLNNSVANYLPNRDLDFRLDQANFNLRDQIRKGENFPLQFAYQAADCRIFYTFDTFNNMSALWSYAAEAIWTNTSLCVQGSTNQPSSGHVTDTVGPSAAQKAAWTATDTNITPLGVNNETTIDVQFTAGINGPDDDIAGRLNAVCDPAFPEYCGQLSCVQAPFCDTKRGIFTPLQYQCVKLCADKCSSSQQCSTGKCDAGSGGTCKFCAPLKPLTSRTCTSKTTNKGKVKNQKVNEPKVGLKVPVVKTEVSHGSIAKAIVRGIGG